MKSRPDVNTVRQLRDDIRARLENDGRVPGSPTLNEDQRLMLNWFAGALDWAVSNDPTFADAARFLIDN